MTAPAFARKRPRLPSSAQVALDYLYEKRRVRKRGFVAMTVADLGKALGKSASQSRRILNLLTHAGQVLRVYNGGQGPKRACIFYVGEIAVRRALELFPAWDAQTGEKPSFPPLRMGRRVLEQRQRKPRKNAGLTPSDSLDSRGEFLSETPPLGDRRCSQTFAADSDDPPGAPPVGAPWPALVPVADAGGIARESPTPAPTPAQNGPKPSEPLSPAKTPASSPRGAQTASGEGASRTGPPARAVVERRTLLCRAWGEWRERYRRAHRREYVDHPRADGRAMNQLVQRALLRARHDQETALTWIAWWFREYLRDPCPPRSPLGERHHPLFRLVRIVDQGDYGPPRGTAPASSARKGPPRAASRSEVVARDELARFGIHPSADPSRGPPAAPATASRAIRPPDRSFAQVLERAERAREALRRAHQKVGLPPPAVEPEKRQTEGPSPKETKS